MHDHPTIAHSLANLNNVVITVSFRNGEGFPWKSGVSLSDLRDVLDWIEEERGKRDVWSEAVVGLVGSSSVR